MVKVVVLASISSISVAWVARSIDESLISKTFDAESTIMFPEVVVFIVKSPDVEFIVRVPAPPISIASPDPAFEIDSTSPVDEEKD